MSRLLGCLNEMSNQEDVNSPETFNRDSDSKDQLQNYIEQQIENTERAERLNRLITNIVIILALLILFS